MRVESIKAWILLGFSLLAIGAVLNLLQVAGQWGIFAAVMGIVYFGIGMVLAIVRDRQMNMRTRAGQGLT
jgi:succinate-acetate transporter protein